MTSNEKISDIVIFRKVFTDALQQCADYLVPARGIMVVPKHTVCSHVIEFLRKTN